jgi:hypothetical protein
MTTKAVAQMSTTKNFNFAQMSCGRIYESIAAYFAKKTKSKMLFNYENEQQRIKKTSNLIGLIITAKQSYF